jgi:hypothetical protein
MRLPCVICAFGLLLFAPAASTDAVTTQDLFPLRTVAGVRYLLDASGRPFFIHGDAAWDLISSMTQADADQYLAIRSAQGFNAILVELIEHKFSPDAPRNVNRDPPFRRPGDFSTPNEAYFAHAEWIIGDALRKRMLVMLTPSYMGYEGGDEGWYKEMADNTPEKLQAFGRYLANRFAAYPNILWVEGGDYNPPERALLDAVPNGIRAVNNVWLHTFHGGRGTSALGFLGTSTEWLGVNDIYTDETNVVAKAYTEYQRSSMPFFLIEDRYEGDKGATALTLRVQAYQAVLSGAAGHIMGNAGVWTFRPGWHAAINNADAASMRNLRELLQAYRWWTLRPDMMGKLLTAGALDGTSRATAAAAADRSVALIYTPSPRTLTVDFSQLAGPRVRARWYDPLSGNYTPISGSPFGTEATQAFTRIGTGDSVLTLESVP